MDTMDFHCNTGLGCMGYDGIQLRRNMPKIIYLHTIPPKPSHNSVLNRESRLRVLRKEFGKLDLEGF